MIYSKLSGKKSVPVPSVKGLFLWNANKSLNNKHALFVLKRTFDTFFLKHVNIWTTTEVAIVAQKQQIQ